MLKWVLLFFYHMSGQVLYHFGKTFGQIYQDQLFSSTERTVNGMSSSIDCADVIPSDRGIYIKDKYSGVKLAPNDISTTATLVTGSFSMALWFMLVPESNGYAYVRLINTKSHSAIFIANTSNEIYFIFYDQPVYKFYTLALSKSKRKFYLAFWTLLGIVITGTSVNFYADNVLKNTITSAKSYLETSVESSSIGSPGCCSSVGFVWYYYHSFNVSEFSNLISNTETSYCFYTGCLSCNPSIKDPVFNMIGCTSIETDPYKSLKGKCNDPTCTSGCSGSYCLNCTCSGDSCKISDSENYCISAPKIFYEVNTCSFTSTNSYSNIVVCLACRTDCITCENSTTCSTCAAQNSHPGNTGCVCDDQYYASSSLLQGGTCQSCPIDCHTCNADKCILCKAENSELNSSSRCICKKSYYTVRPSMDTVDSCKACHYHCLDCVEDKKCVKCLDSNSNPADIGCKCIDGYYLTNKPVLYNQYCLTCLSECLKCENSSSCLECKAKNSVPGTESVCICSPGYYQSGQMTEINACSPCHEDCLLCSSDTICSSCKYNFYLNSSFMCSPCDLSCFGCKSELVCIKCKDQNASISSQLCECNLGFYFNYTFEKCMPCLDICSSCNSSDSCLTCKYNHTYLPYCEECSKDCKSCFGPNSYDCTSCDSLLLSSICSESCPIGFNDSSASCILESPSDPTLKFVFKGLGESFYDLSNQIIAQAKQKLSSIETLPFAVYSRGIYFPGGSYLSIEKNDSKLLNVDFSISI